MSLKSKQTNAIRLMLNFNDNTIDTPSNWSDQWKVLVLDSFCMDILSPLLTVAELRKLGVTLYMNINDKREEIPDVPAIYFLLPTNDNIRMIGDDLKTPLYREFHINFASMVGRSQLEVLATQAVELAAVNLVKKVYDQYMNFIAIEACLFSLNIKKSFIKYNDPRKDEANVMEYIDQVVEGLFASVATMGVVPVIRAKAGTAAEMTANKLDKKIRDYIATGSSLFGGGGGGSSTSTTSFTRPVLLILDRETDYVSMLHHASTYQALAHDLLDLKNNSVTITIKKGASAGKKTYHLDSESDEFWNKYAGASFPEAVQNNDKELQAITAKETSIRSATGGGGGGEEKFDISSGMKDLLSVTDSLPQLLEKKKKLEMHTNILSATMEQIAQREIPTFYEIEEQMVLTGMIADKVAFEELITNPSKGSLQDKLRLLCIAILTTEIDNVNTLEKHLISLSETSSEGDFVNEYLKALNWIKKHKAFNKPNKSSSIPLSLPNNVVSSDSAASNALNMGFSLANSLLAKATAQVKTFLPGNKRLPATNLLATVMDNAPLTPGSVDPFIYLDPKFRGSKGSMVPRQNTSFKEAIVFFIGGGSYTEYQNIQDFAQQSSTSSSSSSSGGGVGTRQVIYGCTELLSSSEFLKQLNEISS